MDALSEIFSFQGRANRAWYLLHIILDDAVIFALIIAMIVLGLAFGPLVALPLAGVIVGGVVAATAVSVKRLHDLDMSGWHVLGLMVPLWNVYIGLKMLLVKGTDGPNRFGRDPLARGYDIDDGVEEAYLLEA